MILLKPAQVAEFVTLVQERGERMVIIVTPERIEAYMGGEEPRHADAG